MIYRTPYPNELYHHGVKGQKWGVRRYQNSDGTLTAAGKKHYSKQNLKNARVSNLNKFGKSPDTNILFIAGYSGSGKSTAAQAISKKNDKVIHLDTYSEPFTKESVRSQNKDFNSFLDKEVPNWKLMANSKTDGSTKIKRFSKEYWDIAEDFQKATEKYSKEQYKKNNRVIVEGIQIADDWFAENKAYYSNKPMIILGTSPVTSLSRALKRDGAGNILISSIKNVDLAKQRIRTYSIMNDKLNDLATITKAKKGKKYVNDLLNG